MPVCGYVHVCTSAYGALGATVRTDCELPDMGLGTKLRSFTRVHGLYSRTISPAPIF